MKIGIQKQRSDQPPAVTSTKSFLDTSEDNKGAVTVSLENATAAFENVLDAVATMVEPAVEAAMNRVPQRGFLQALSEAVQGGTNQDTKDDDTPSVVDEAHGVLDHRSRVDKYSEMKKSIEDLLQQHTMHNQTMTIEETSSSLETTSTLVDVAPKDNVEEMIRIIDRLTSAIEKFGITPEDCLVEGGDTCTSRSEKLLLSMEQKRLAHAVPQSVPPPPTASTSVLKKLENQILGLNRWKSVDDKDGVDCLNSNRYQVRDSYLSPYSQRMVVVRGQSRPQSPTTARPREGTSVIAPDTACGASSPHPPPSPPEIIDLGSPERVVLKEQFSRIRSRTPSPPRAVSSPSKSDESSVPDEIFLSRPQSPPRSSKSSPRSPRSPTYCSKCMHVVSVGRRGGSTVELLLEEEMGKWRMCRNCVLKMFPSFFGTNPIGPLTVGTKLGISFRPGDLLYELCGRASIPIKWTHHAEEIVFVSIAHLVMFELAKDKDLVRAAKCIEDVDKLIDKDLAKFVVGYERKIGPIVRSVCQLQLQQHPLLHELVSVIIENGVHLHVVTESCRSTFDKTWLAPNIIAGWIGDGLPSIN